MTVVVIHVLLLFVKRAYCGKTLCLPWRKRSSKGELFLNRGEVPSQIAQLLANRFPHFLCCLFPAAAELKKITVRLLAVSAGLPAIRRIVQLVKELFGVFPCFVEQGCVLGIPDVGRCTGRVYNHGSTVAAVSLIIVIFVFCGLCYGAQNHLIDLTQNLWCQSV